MRAQRLHRLIGGKARWAGGDLENHAARLAEVDGVEVLPVQHWRDIQSSIDEPLAPFALSLVVGHPPRDVVNRANRDAPRQQTWRRAHVYIRPGARARSAIPEGLAVLACGLE